MEALANPKYLHCHSSNHANSWDQDVAITEIFQTDLNFLFGIGKA